MRKILVITLILILLSACVPTTGQHQKQLPMETPALQQVPLATQVSAMTDNFSTWNTSVWKLGYPWGTTDNNMGKAYAANVSVADGALCLKAQAVNNVGSITSVQQFGYGSYSARMKFSNMSNGAWGGVWMLNDPAGWEIDIAELLGIYPNRFYTSLHYGGNQVLQNPYKSPASLNNEWHIYDWTWSPSNVSFDIDGVTHTSFTYSKSPTTNMIFTMGLMSEKINWDGNHVDSSTFTNGSPTLCVDWFAYVPLGSTVPTGTPTITPSKTSTPIKTITLTPTRTPTITSTPTSTFTGTPTLIFSPTFECLMFSAHNQEVCLP